MQGHREKRTKALASMAREQLRRWTFVQLAATAAFALLSHGVSAAAPLVPLDRNPTELLSRDWLQGNVRAPGRRITTKSIFIVPERAETQDCPQGTWRSGGRCMPFLHLDEAARVQLLLDRLNVQYGTAPSSELNSDDGYDYEETIPEAQGPLQVNIPLPPQLLGTTPPRAITPEPVSRDKVIPSIDAVSTDNEGYIKIQNSTELQDNPTLVDQLESLKGNLADGNKQNPIDSIVSMDGNIAIEDKYIVGASESEHATETVADQIQLNDKKHIESEQDSSSLPFEQDQNISQNSTSSTETDTPGKPTNIANVETITTKLTSEKSSYVKNKIRDKIKYDENLQNKLRPELDYSDLSETIKIISRFAEITTDDTFKAKNSSKDSYSTELNDNPLGTRTKLEHLKKFSRYNKTTTNTRGKAEPLERIDSHENPLVNSNFNRMEYMKREIKDSWQRVDKQLLRSHIDAAESALDSAALTSNPRRHRPRRRRLQSESAHMHRARLARAEPSSQDLLYILGLAQL